MHLYAIDSIKQISSNITVVTGWSNIGVLKLRISGDIVHGASVKDIRPDLSANFGEGAENWGFSAIFRTAIPVDVVGNAELLFYFDSEYFLVPAERIPLERSIGDNTSHAIFLDAIGKRTNAKLIELGSRARSGNTYRHMFHSGIDYVGVDISEGPNVDVVADAHNLPDDLAESFDFAYSVSTFEHFLMPWKVALELNKVLRVGGMAYIQSHASWPIHDEPWDFFRFSKYAWVGLFNIYTGFEVVCANHNIKASIVPEFSTGAPLMGIANESTFLLSACVIRKIGNAQVSWPAPTSDMVGLSYSY